MQTWTIPNDLYIYDCEVFRRYWLFVFKHKLTGKYTIIDSYDYDALKDFYSTNPLLCGFNNLAYDKWIAKAVRQGLSCPEIKDISDEIVKHEQKAWRLPQFEQSTVADSREFDLMLDCQKGMSLKAIEGHLGMNIKETDVDFNLDRCLTEDEKALTIKYCKADVDATDKLFDIRKDYLESKIFLGRMAGFEDDYSLSKTNQSLDCRYLGAVRHEYSDGRSYTPPKVLDQSVIPKDTFAFLNQINNHDIPDDVIFPESKGKKGKEGINFHETKIGACPVTYGWGGVHGVLSNTDIRCEDDEVFEDRDVSSLYPSLLIEYDYLSRSVPPEGRKRFREAKAKRIEAKHNGDKATAKALKLPLNATSGGMDARFSDLYDPHNARSMRITGELLITELVQRLTNEIPSFMLCNLNTDGFFYKAKKADYPKIQEICNEWSKRTRLELEVDHVDRMIQKDVNNYIAIEGKETKTTGGDLNWGINTKGVFSVNNNLVAVKKALIAYLVDGVPIEKTIKENRDILDFQMISKVGGFDYGYQIVNGEQVRTQKVNRVYATKDTTKGTLYRVKNGQSFKIASLPDHCLIDNANEASREDIDDDFYIMLAMRKANDFIPRNTSETQMTIEECSKEKFNMPNENKEETLSVKKEDNVFQKLAVAKILVTKESFYKSGSVVGRNIAYDYTQLGDFLPKVTEILYKCHLIGQSSMHDTNATLTIVNIDNPSDTTVYSMPIPNLTYYQQSGKMDNPADAMKIYGAYTTYSRRYLYLIALDLITSDEIEESEKTKNKALEQKALEKKVADRKKAQAEALKKPEPETPIAKTTAPATPTERKEIVNQLTSSSCSNFDKFRKEANTLIVNNPSAKDKVVAIINHLKGNNSNYKTAMTEEELKWGLDNLALIGKEKENA